jgi:hypothetical protein
MKHSIVPRIISGYSSYFADPDGYLWEVAYNPFVVFDGAGNLKMD